MKNAHNLILKTFLYLFSLEKQLYVESDKQDGTNCKKAECRPFRR